MRWDAVERRPWVWGLLLGAAHGVCFGVAFRPVAWWPMGLVSLAPLLALAWFACDARKAALAVWATAFPAWFFYQRWLIDVTALGWPVLAAYLSLYPAAFVWLGVRLRRTRWVGERTRWWVLMALLWAGLESLRAEVIFHGYAWYLIGELTLLGVVPTALVVSALTGSVLRSWRRGSTRLRWIGFGAVCAASVLAAMVPGNLFPELDPRYLVVGVVQSNVPQSNKIAWGFEQKVKDFERMKSLTREAAAKGAEVIVWPETMFPGLALNAEAVEAERAARLTNPGGVASTVFYEDLLALQREVGVPLIVGAIAAEGVRFIESARGVEWKAERKFNSVFVVQDGAVDERRYDKMHLTPFGETMPYISWNKWLEGKLLALGAGGMKFDLSAGRDQMPLEVRPTKGRLAGETVRVATPVCFEMTDAGLVRGLVDRGADLIVTVTNDGWFGPYAGGREEHVRAAARRGWELGCVVVRAANTGVSAIMFGTWGVTLPPWTEGVLVERVSIPHSKRPQLLGFSSWISPACLAILGVGVAYASIGGRRRGAAAQPAAAAAG